MSSKHRHYSELTKPIVTLLQKLAYRHSLWDVFTDFLLMAATAISNSVDPLHFDEREKLYMDTVKKYTKEELAIFPELFAELVVALDVCVQRGRMEDLLGRVYHELELHNKWKGQFFTPQNIADMMTAMCMGSNDQAVEKYGFISVGEPCCGSGVMVISFANAVQEAGYSYSTQMVADCTDVDLKCVHMCYIQLSLYGIPAIIHHGNSISMEMWSHWLTPVYIMGGWSLRQWWKTTADEKPEEKPEGAATEPVAEKKDFDVNLHETENGQISLF